MAKSEIVKRAKKKMFYKKIFSLIKFCIFTGIIAGILIFYKEGGNDWTKIKNKTLKAIVAFVNALQDDNNVETPPVIKKEEQEPVIVKKRKIPKVEDIIKPLTVNNDKLPVVKPEIQEKTNPNIVNNDVVINPNSISTRKSSTVDRKTNTLTMQAIEFDKDKILSNPQIITVNDKFNKKFLELNKNETSSYIPLQQQGYDYPMLSQYDKIFIWKETENYDYIEPSFEVASSNECSNGKYLTFRQDNGALNHGCGKSEYNIEISKTADYAFWGRVLWESGCANLFTLHIETETGEKITPKRRQRNIAMFEKTSWREHWLGKDTSLYDWHWIGNHIFPLKKGKYKLILGHGLSGSHIDKFLLTTDIDYKPKGLQEWTSKNWYAKKDNWIVGLDKKNPNGKFNFLKKKDIESPVFFKNVNCNNFYVRLNCRGEKLPHIYLNYTNEGDFLRISQKDNKIVLEEQIAGGLKTLSESDGVSWKNIRLNALLEIFKEKNIIKVILDNNIVFEDSINKKIINVLGFDVIKNMSMNNIEIYPIEKIHVGCFFYCGGPRPFENVSGEWGGSKGQLFCTSRNGITLTGEDWWKNYQMTFMCSAPMKGKGGVVFYYKDEKNYYYLSIGAKTQVLYCVEKGKQTQLGFTGQLLKTEKDFEEFKEREAEALKAIEKNKNRLAGYIKTIEKYEVQLKERYKRNKKTTRLEYRKKQEILKEKLDAIVEKKVKLEEDLKNPNKKKHYVTKTAPHRFTINRVNDIIQVYINGKHCIESKDTTFKSGKAGFISEKSDIISFDDIEITEIGEIHKGNKNEIVAKFNDKYKTINSVMDAYAAMGGKHHGDHSEFRNEDILSDFARESLNTSYTKEKVEILDFQWLNFTENVFKEIPGESKGKGYIEFNAYDGQRHYLWSSKDLFGNWTYSFQVKGNIEEFGLMLKDQSQDGFNSDYYVFIYDTQHNKISYEKKDVKQDSNIKQSMNNIEWDNNKDYDIRFEKINTSIFLFINNKFICEHRNISENILWRSAIMLKNGTGQLDNIEAITSPNAFYNFSYNQSWWLTLSDWDAFYKRKQHGGNYYSYISLKDEENKNNITPSLTSKREYKNEFMMLTQIENRDSEEFNISIVTETGETIQFKLTEYEIQSLCNDNLVASEVLSNFSTFNRRLHYIRLWIKDSIVRVYLTDGLASQRLVMKCKINLAQGEPFKLQLSAFPELEVKHILIWGEEVY